MHGTVAVTDYGWYQFLLTRQPPEVNFWTPSDRRAFRAPEFAPFFFKLGAPRNAICGFGYFAKWTSLPDWLAWDCFGEGNGVESLSALRARIAAIRKRIDYDNGRSYYSLRGNRIALPAKEDDYPAAEFVSWHNSNVYLG